MRNRRPCYSGPLDLQATSIFASPSKIDVKQNRKPRRVKMKSGLTAVMLGGLAMVNAPTLLQGQLPSGIAAFTSSSSSEDAPTLPPLPSGKTTIFGGEIRSVDPVLDQLTLNVYGARPMRMLFDERTEVYRDGKKISLRDLGATEHASIETTLDGIKVFAVSIHILSHMPEGEYE